MSRDDPWPNRGLGVYDTCQQQDDATNRQMMLSYYVSDFVPAVSVVVTPQSYYTALYMPLAFQSSGVYNAIIACSALHASRHALEQDRKAHLLALSSDHQRKCHLFLKERITMSGQPFKDAHEVVAVTLLLTGMEAISATGGSKWLQQLGCLRAMITQLHSNQNGTYNAWALDCLACHFTYHWTMATVTSQLMANGQAGIAGASPTNLVTEASASWLSKDFEPDQRPPDPLMGIGQSLFPLICRLDHITLPSEARDVVTTEAFTTLEHDLNNWRPQLAILSSEDHELLDLSALAEACRLAGLLMLHRLSDRQHSLLPILAARILRTVARIPSGSSVEAGLTFPLFLAGAEVRNKVDIDQCTARLDELHDRYRLENIAKARRLHELIHQRRNENLRLVDWTEILLEKCWTISLS